MITFAYIVSLPALLIIAVTVIARLNDIGRNRVGWWWHMRRLGFILAGLAAVGYLLKPIWGAYGPSWYSVALQWGLAFVWLTTPCLPPWWKYVSGEYKQLPQTPRRRNDDLPLP